MQKGLYAQFRGERLNNPLNIRHSGSDWVGAANKQSDREFVEFDDVAYGFRAAAKILLNYQSRFGLWSIGEIIHRWAPSSENDTNAYIERVCKDMRLGPQDRIDLKSSPVQLLCLVDAMTRVEQGRNAYTLKEMAEGIQMALNAQP